MNIKDIENKDIEKYRSKLLFNYDLFNEKNENIYKDFSNLSLIFKQREKSNIKIISDKDKDIFLIWYDYRNYGTYIRSLVPLFKLNDYESIDYQQITQLLKRSSSYKKDKYLYEYITKDNIINNYVLNELGFKKVSKLIDMRFDLNNQDINISEIKFYSEFKDNTLEQMTLDLLPERVKIQNKIFHAKDRSPVSRTDLFLDMNSRSYMEDLSFFYKKGKKKIGYSQIGVFNKTYHLINFGIIPKYRKRGYALDFLYNILRKSKEYGIDDLRLTVDKENKKAINLYEKCDFKKISSTSTWHYLINK